MGAPVTPSTDQLYCAAQLRARDELRWFALQYARPDDQRALTALYAFSAEIARVPSSVSEPPLGEIRLEWWREALEEIAQQDKLRAHPLVAELANCWPTLAPIAGDLRQLIDGTTRPLYAPYFDSAADLAGFVDKAVVPADLAAWQVLGGDSAGRAQIKETATLYAMARFLPKLNMPVSGEVRAACLGANQKAKRALAISNARSAPLVLPFLCVGGFLREAPPTSVQLARLRKRLRMFVGMALGQ